MLRSGTVPASHMGGDEAHVCVLDTETLVSTYRVFGAWDDETEHCAGSEAEALVLAMEAAP